MFIIPNGINVEEYDLPPEKHEGFVVGFVGRVARIKDLKTAIRAISIVKEVVGEKLKFLIIGPVTRKITLPNVKDLSGFFD